MQVGPGGLALAWEQLSHLLQRAVEEVLGGEGEDQAVGGEGSELADDTVHLGTAEYVTMCEGYQCALGCVRVTVRMMVVPLILSAMLIVMAQCAVQEHNSDENSDDDW